MKSASCEEVATSPGSPPAQFFLSPMEGVRAALGRVAQRRAPLRAHFLKLVQRHAVEAERRGLRFKPETLAAIDTAVRSEAAKPTKA